ncbi:hypothetical protein HY095_00140 [Candidatus Micrarchaeota archaeon]|nr:hypothetical protein [Candidatus Micrarchaeota archaeon]
MKRGSDWSPVYMVIVAVIALIVIVSLIKPIFANSASQAAGNINAASDFARGAIFP